MWYPAEISLSSYLPSELEVGMLFTNRISVGVIDPYVELFELEEIPEDADAFINISEVLPEVHKIEDWQVGCVDARQLV